MATLNDTVSNDEDYAMILQTEEIILAEKYKNDKKVRTKEVSNRSNRRIKPNYVCIDDEIITIDDDHNSDLNTVDLSDLNPINERIFQKEDIIRQDEILARKIQVELDKELAQSLETNHRSKQREVEPRTLRSDFDINARNLSSSLDNDMLFERFHLNSFSSRRVYDNTDRTSTNINRQSTISNYLTRQNSSNDTNRIQSFSLNLNNEIGFPNHHHRRNRRLNQLHVFNQFNVNNHDFTSNDYEELIRLDETNVKKGLNRTEIDSLPSFEYKSNNVNRTSEDSDHICSICQDDFEIKAKIIALACSHKFHRKCIEKWLNQSRRCPLCQKDAINGN